MQRPVGLSILVVGLVLCALSPLKAAEVYQDQVRPFTQKFCVSCHNGMQARGELDLGRYNQAGDVVADFRRWSNVIEFIRSGEMPPEDAPQQPSVAERAAVVEALEAILLTEARKHAGDPGVILLRRLSNTEYDRSIRDLTGVDIRPTRDFPADPAAGEGFDNTGEALSMSPSLLKKYLAAAQDVSHHLVLKPHGITFAPFPVTSYNERKKLTEQAIIDFYQVHEVRIADYLEAAWRYRHRGAAERNVSVEAWAQRRGLSSKYLALVWQTLNEASSSAGYLKQVGDKWVAIPAPTADGRTPPELAAFNKFIEFCRGKLCAREESLIRSNAGNWPIGHLDFRTRTAAQRDRFDPGVFHSQCLVKFDKLAAPKDANSFTMDVMLRVRIEPAIGGSAGNLVILHHPVFSTSGNLPRNEDEAKKQEVVTMRAILEQHSPDTARRLEFGRHPRGDSLDRDSLAVVAPAVLEIPVSPELLERLSGKQLLVSCELDPVHSKEGSVQIVYAIGDLPETRDATNIELLVRPDSELAQKLAASSERFCRTFPNRFFYVDGQRGLAAGFHLVEGFFRDDRPLVEKVLDEQQLRELDQLWEELDFVTESAETLIRGFVWFERSERHVLHDQRFDFLRAEDPRLVDRDMLARFETVYLEKMGVKFREGTTEPETPSDKYEMIHGFFEQIRAGLDKHRRLLASAEQTALENLEDLACRAYRRSLRAKESEELRTLYRSLRSQGQKVEASLRGVLTAILMSPDFCYRYTDAPSGTGVYPLADDALAGRLSYFLWSSLPDEPLVASASEGKLQDPQALWEQTQRMLKDPRVDGFAREFFGQWLRFRDYLDKDPINAPAFPGYTEEVRRAMFDEPVRLVTYLIQEDRPITDLLNTDITFVNGALARHYGGEIAAQYQSQVTKWVTDHPARGTAATGKPDEVWHRVAGLRNAGRGGLFGMAVILTKNSSGERTSPVKRGFWTVHHLLGQHFPPPPADVPELPPNEKQAAKTIRQLIAEHTANPKCAMCHTHFDSLGMALEGFDPIGRARTNDLAGRAIDDEAQFPNGETARGIPGLIDYIEQHRRRDFVRTLCRKFLGYALGRSVALSDQPLLNEMEAALEENDYRFSVLFRTVVQSPQFRQQRGREFVAANP